MARQKRLERALADRLGARCQGYCEDCGRRPDWRGLSKHEKLKRSQGGDPLDEANCIMLCGPCHSRHHGIREVLP